MFKPGGLSQVISTESWFLDIEIICRRPIPQNFLNLGRLSLNTLRYWPKQWTQISLLWREWSYQYIKKKSGQVGHRTMFDCECKWATGAEEEMWIRHHQDSETLSAPRPAGSRRLQLTPSNLMCNLELTWAVTWTESPKQNPSWGPLWLGWDG